MKRVGLFKFLRVQVELLFSGFCRDELAPYDLKDTLPPTLKSGILYVHEGYGKKKITRQIHGNTDFPRLSCLALEAPVNQLLPTSLRSEASLQGKQHRV